MKTKINQVLVNSIAKIRAGKSAPGDAELSRLIAEGKRFEIRDTELPGFTLRIQPSGVMVYTMVYARGKRVTIGGAETVDATLARETAKSYAAEHTKARHGLGEDPVDKRKRVKAENYLQFLKESYEPQLLRRPRAGTNNAENVKETMACLVNRFPEFHKLGLDEITPLAIDKWCQRRMTEGVTPSTIKRQLNDLRACLNKAIKWGALKSDPFQKVEPIKIDSNQKVRYLTKQEESAIRKRLDEREERIKTARQNANQWRDKRGYELYEDLTDCQFADYLKPAVLVSLNTGLRRGELLGLKWSDIDFEHKQLTVRGDGAKSGQTRHIPLNEEAFNILKEWKSQPGLKSVTVFHGKDGEQLQNLRKSWMAILRQNPAILDFRWHDLRHTFASNLVMRGVDLNTVRELLGHSDYKMTLRYSHLAPRIKADAVSKLVDRRAVNS